ncbi:MAG: heparinase [Alphaproteobacteria bacterium]|nr:heparinase [Alphaproteobacteria bacterium]
MSQAIRLGDYASALWMSARRELSSSYNALGLPQFLNGTGSIPAALAYAPTDFYTADLARGAAILEGRFPLAGDQIMARDDRDIWRAVAPSRAFAGQLHSFVWLRDCAALPEAEGAAEARRLVDSWISRYSNWNSFVWSESVLSSRILNWLRCGEALFDPESSPDKAHTKRLKSLLRQVRHLQRTYPLAEDGLVKFRSACALVLSGLCLPQQDSLLKTALGQLEQEVTRQILPDGGHVSRSPGATADALIDLTTLVEVAEARSIDLPSSIQKAIDRLRPMTRFFLMDDGGLAAFHGGGEGDRGAIKTALERGKPSRSFGFAPHSGYHRYVAGGATVLFDVGDPPGGRLSTNGHASALAIEMATPGGRLVVNCGWHDDQSADWREAVRATAAHSTLVLEEASSSRLLPPGWQRNLLGPRLASRPSQVTARRNEEDMGVWLEGVQTGYREEFGLLHRRRIFQAADGGDMRGEDALFRSVSDGAPDDVDLRYRFAIRFHLHPSVRASLSRDSMSALLVQPNGDGWRFRTDGGPVSLERSVYLAAGAPPQRTQQIVIHGEAEPFGAGDRPPNRVRWAFQRLGRIGGTGGGTE